MLFIIEYESIASEWQMDKWEWMKTFHIDALLFQVGREIRESRNRGLMGEFGI